MRLVEQHVINCDGKRLMKLLLLLKIFIMLLTILYAKLLSSNMSIWTM